MLTLSTTSKFLPLSKMQGQRTLSLPSLLPGLPVTMRVLTWDNIQSHKVICWNRKYVSMLIQRHQSFCAVYHHHVIKQLSKQYTYEWSIICYGCYVNVAKCTWPTLNICEVCMTLTFNEKCFSLNIIKQRSLVRNICICFTSVWRISFQEHIWTY